MGISTAVDPSAVGRAVGIKTAFKDLRGGAVSALPQRLAVIGQGSSASVYSTDKATVGSALEVAQVYGFGSPLHLAVLQLLPANGDGVGSIPVTVYPLDDDVGGVVASGDITPTIAATEPASFQIRVNNILSTAFTIETTDTAALVAAKMTAAINAVLEMPIIAATAITPDRTIFTSKWQGVSANDIVVEIVGPTTVGNTFAITQAAGGAANPDVDVALNQVGNVWETLILNCMDIADTATLDKISLFGEGRWGALTRKPVVAFTGNTNTTVANAIAVPDARKTDRVNAQLVAPGSNDLPFIVAARELARIAVQANSKPAFDYGRLLATGLTAGADGDQWNYAQRDQAVKAGSSTVESSDSVVVLSDTVTFYHPAGDPNPAYRYVVDIIKLMNVLHNIDVIFATPEWDGAPLIPDDQPTVNRDAKKPKAAVAAIAFMLDNLALEAIISDPESSKAATIAAINASNPKRLDIATTVKLSGNTNIVSIDLNFGFNFGTSPLV